MTRGTERTFWLSPMNAAKPMAQRQQTGVAGDLAARKIGVDRLMTVEGEGQLW